MDSKLIILNLTLLERVGRLATIVQLIKILSRRTVQIKRSVYSRYDADRGIRTPLLPRKCFVDCLLNIGGVIQISKRFLNNAFSSDGIFDRK